MVKKYKTLNMMWTQTIIRDGSTNGRWHNRGCVWRIASEWGQA